MRPTTFRRSFRILALSAALVASLTAATPNGPTVQAAATTGSHSVIPMRNDTKTATPIHHLVVVYQENRSFDSYFGTYPLDTQGGFRPSPNTPIPNGLPQGISLTDSKGNKVTPQRLDKSQTLTEDFNHSYDGMIEAYDNGKMDRYLQVNHDDPKVMSYYDYEVLKPLWEYAQHFAMADNWYQPVFGPSTPGALYLVAAQTGDAAHGGPIRSDPDPYYGPWNNPNKALDHPLTFPNIADRLNAKQISWAWYQEGYQTGEDYSAHHNPFQYFESTHDAPNLKDYTRFLEDAKKGQLPAVSFVKASSAHDEHPKTSDEIEAMRWLTQTVNAVMQSPNWRDTAIVITYDESGGLYDHVAPPQLPDSMRAPDGLQGLGPRVPTLVLSPYSKSNYISHVQYDTTSILKFIETNWGVPALTARDRNAANLNDFFDFHKALRERNHPYLLPLSQLDRFYYGAPTVDLTVLSTNDFHGHLNPQTVSGSPAGGAAWLAAYLERDRAENPKATLTLDAGDLVGASPLESQALQDKPAIDYANLVGYDNVTFGNHEFDAGLSRLQQQVGWAKFPYWSANVIDKQTGKPLWHPVPYEIFYREGIPVGVINLTTESTPSIVNPSGIQGLQFRSTVDATNQAVAQLHRRGVHTIILLAHLGTDAMMDPDGSKLVTDPNDIAKNEAAKLARAVDDDVDLIVSGHTHQGVNTYVDGKLIVQAYAYGTAFADVTLRVNTQTRDVVDKSAEIRTTWHFMPDKQTPAITPDPRVQKGVDQANAAVAPIANEVVGQAAVPLTRDQAPSPGSTQGIGGESNLGDVVADAMLEGAKKVEPQVTFAFMNAGGIRTDIPQGPITRGKVIEVLPFQNVLATVTLTGDQVKAVLEQGASGQHGMVQVAGLHFSYDPNQPLGSRVTHITLAGTDKMLDPNGNYRVVTNDFMLNGGDNYVTFQQGKDPVFHSDALLSDVVVQYIQAHTPIDQQIEGRITVGH